MRSHRRTLATAFVAACVVLASPAFATRERSTQLALEAKEALDAHFGRAAQLTSAAALLTGALTEDPTDATLYVQAARLTIKGGHVVSTQHRPGTVDAYGELLDRALALDPRNAKARILKAEYFYLKGDYASERSELDRARETGTRDSWLLIGYARHHARAGDASRARSYYAEARARGPGSSLEQRNAYVASLTRLAFYAAVANDETTLREVVATTRKQRDPRDAWALGNLAHILVGAGLFDEAIALAREALGVMDYGAGRLTLAAALYARAAESTATGNIAAAGPFLKEAREYGFSRSAVMGQFARGNAKSAPLLPTIEALVR